MDRAMTMRSADFPTGRRYLMRPRFNFAATLIAAVALTWGSAAAFASDAAISRGLLYLSPDVAILTDSGRPMRLTELMDADRTVIVDFIFTSCQAICPVMSATFGQLARKLGADHDRVRLISVSIDPETDTPAVLREYASRFHAGPEWTFVTGGREDIAAIQKAFANFQRNKMEHVAVYFLRPPHAREWIRIEGAVTSADLFAVYQREQRR
jgi:protein SCO1/2